MTMAAPLTTAAARIKRYVIERVSERCAGLSGISFDSESSRGIPRSSLTISSSTEDQLDSVPRMSLLVKDAYHLVAPARKKYGRRTGRAGLSTANVSLSGVALSQLGDGLRTLVSQTGGYSDQVPNPNEGIIPRRPARRSRSCREPTAFSG
jgi:hypothetical protein